MGLDKLIDLFIQFLKFFQFTEIVNAWQTGIRLRFGKFQAVLKPGLHFYLPFYIDKILMDNTVTETMNVRPQSLTTKDRKAVVVSTVVTFRIEDIKAFLLEIENRNHAIEDCATGATAAYIMKHTYDELVEMDDVDNELAKVVRKAAKKYGVNVISVQLANFVLARSLRLFSSERLALPS